MPNRSLTVYYTSDIHGCFPAAGGQPGFAALIKQLAPGENALILDGGDVLQGSPFAYYLASVHKNAEVAAGLFNLAGCRYVTLGNHDFSYGKDELEKYLSLLKAECLCANVRGIAGVKPFALTVLPNGLKIGLTGVITPFVPQWEKPENLADVSFTDPLEAARSALEALKKQNADITVCLCHMGFENDPVTGEVLSSSGENRLYGIAKTLGFTLVLGGHTHAAFAGGRIGRSYACAVDDKAARFIRAEIREDGSVTSALLSAGTEPDAAAAAFLAPYERECAAFLSRPLGRLSGAIEEKEFLELALHGSPLVNLINSVQKQTTGADISCAALTNTPASFGPEVSAGNVIEAYPFANTLTVLEVGRAVIKSALEKTASFLTLDENGCPALDKSLLAPVKQFFNFDFFSGIYAKIDLSRPAGSRVISVLYRDRELPEGKKLRLCLNSYRASGAGGYPFYRDCPVLFAGQDDMQSLLLETLARSGETRLDPERYTEYTNGKESV